MAVLNILDDIEEEKNNAESLARDLEKYMLAVAGVSDHIVITDQDGIILFANIAVETITGFSNEEIIGKKAGSKELWGGNMEREVYTEFWKTIKTEKKPFSGVFKNKRKDGREYDASAHVSPILDKKGNVVYFVGIERDVTRELDIDRAKTEFVSLASHQLRTPLSAINWYTEMLLNGDAGKISKEQKQYLNEIYKGNHRMVDLVSSLLNVSRLELGTFEIFPEKLDISKIAVDVIQELQPLITEKNIVVTEKYTGNQMLMADSKLMRNIIQNLVSNAVKYTKKEGKVSLSIARKPKTEDLEIQVSDTGYGIPKNQQKKIFTKLFRADNVKVLDTEGTGLGLYIVKEVVDASGGSVSFKSTENIGTTFSIVFPKTGMKQKEGTKHIE
jgi:PAS domain S-box-containing protein